MKKLTIFLLAGLLIASLLAGCATNGTSSQTDGTSSQTEGSSNQTTESSSQTTESSSETSESSSETTTTETEATPTPIPAESAAFEGTADEVLDLLISKTIEKKVVADEELNGIKCYYKKVDADSCQDILGLAPGEFASELEDAVESKPEGSWFAHSIVMIKCNPGVDAAAMAEKISKGTNPARFGCIKAETVVVGQAGQYILLCASFKTTSDAVYTTFSELSAVTATRIDRENDWSGGGLGG
jgi:hypothetical protein